MKAWLEKKSEIRKFKKEEASWLAGVIDGEGSIGLYDYGKLNSERLKREWRDPAIRKKRIEGLRRYYESKKK